MDAKKQIHLQFEAGKMDDNYQWEYRFYIDINGNLHDPAVKNALQGVRTEVADFKILGNY